MRRGLELDELIEHWTLVGEELGRACAKRGVNALAFALLLKFVIHYGRFPRGCSEIPDEAVEFVARQVQVGPGELGFYGAPSIDVGLILRGEPGKAWWGGSCGPRAVGCGVRTGRGP